MSKTVEIQKAVLEEAQGGSWFTILGAGGDPHEWVEGVEKILEEKGIGKPVAWYSTTGEDINRFAEGRKGEIEYNDTFQEDLAVLMFPLEGLSVGKLAMFKLQFGARWFDDIVMNMRAVR